MRSSVVPSGIFQVGVHKPSYSVKNLRQHDFVDALGELPGGQVVKNTANFPVGDVTIREAQKVYEILNALPFRGCTYINSGWADATAADRARIKIDQPGDCSLRGVLNTSIAKEKVADILPQLPRPLLYALAANSTDPGELVILVNSCCEILFDQKNQPRGLRYRNKENRLQPVISDFELFETLANNPYLPDPYKEIMVLRPGAQGDSEISGDFFEGETGIFEYLRGNSYIPWGHFAANFAHKHIRYGIGQLTPSDMQGLRHLYYQRTFIILAEKFGIRVPAEQRRYSSQQLEELRLEIVGKIYESEEVAKLATLWGWNFGYDFSGSGYSLHASHQMIHQQYAMVPEQVELTAGGTMPSYCCGDMVAEVVALYHQEYHADFFDDYLHCLEHNTRTDGREGLSSLKVWEDENVVLFVPKAQVSQWELQLMVKGEGESGPVGNIIEADEGIRKSLDLGILQAQQILAGLGAKMVTSIEYPKRLGVISGQRLLYAFLPKLPWSMGAFSEAQLRYICGHYPEDFAAACRDLIV